MATDTRPVAEEMRLRIADQLGGNLPALAPMPA